MRIHASQFQEIRIREAFRAEPNDLMNPVAPQVVRPPWTGKLEPRKTRLSGWDRRLGSFRQNLPIHDDTE
jgi:hypothetical protein